MRILETVTGATKLTTTLNLTSHDSTIVSTTFFAISTSMDISIEYQVQDSTVSLTAQTATTAHTSVSNTEGLQATLPSVFGTNLLSPQSSMTDLSLSSLASDMPTNTLQLSICSSLLSVLNEVDKTEE